MSAPCCWCAAAPGAGGRCRKRGPSVVRGLQEVHRVGHPRGMVAQLPQLDPRRAVHRRELGGTPCSGRRLSAGEMDVYPEYTGTLRQELSPGRSLRGRRRAARGAGRPRACA